MTGSEQVLINDWCQQYPSHSVGTLLFGRDGTSTSAAATAPASTTSTTVSRRTTPATRPIPAAIRPGGRHGAEPTRGRGRRAASQSVRRTDGPATLDGAVLRIDPATGAACPATLLRLGRIPTRAASWPTGCATRSGSPYARAPTSSGSATSAGTPGKRSTASSTATPGANFGWPCYEGAARGRLPGRQPQSLLVAVLDAGSVTAPYYTYNHSACVVTRETAARPAARRSPAWRSPAAGQLPGEYNGALFFADHTRNEIWAMLPGTNGLPEPARLQSSSA